MYTIKEIAEIMNVDIGAAISAKIWSGARCDNEGYYSAVDAKLIVQQLGI